MTTFLAKMERKAQGLDQKAPNFRAVLYGTEGVGKTTLAAKILNKILDAEESPRGILHIDIGENWSSIKNIEGQSRRVSTIPFESIQETLDIVDLIRDKQGTFAYIGGIILDEASSMAQQETDRLYELREAGEFGANNIEGSLVPTWPDYNKSLVAVRRLIDRIVKIPDLHLVVVAHEQDRKKTPTSTIAITQPSFSPKIGEKVVQPMHVVGRITAETVKTASGVHYRRDVQIQPTATIKCKTRIKYDGVKITDDALVDLVADWVDKGAIPSAPNPTIFDELPGDPMPTDADIDLSPTELEEEHETDGEEVYTPPNTNDKTNNAGLSSLFSEI